MFSSRNKEKCWFSGKYILLGQVDFDHFTSGKVIKFDNSTTLPLMIT